MTAVLSLSDEPVCDSTRTLPQHETALTLIRSRLTGSTDVDFRWLDIGCGRGQIVANLGESLDEHAIARIVYYAYDCADAYAKQACVTARTQGARAHYIVNDAAKIGDVYEDQQFDFITILNTVHETRPYDLPTIIFDGICRLRQNGQMHVYDLETVRPPEVGAVRWQAVEIRAIAEELCRIIGVSQSAIPVSRFPHSVSYTWSILVNRSDIGHSDEQLLHARTDAVCDLRAFIASLLKNKLANCQAALESATLKRNTSTEYLDCVELVHDFWALTHAMECM